MPRDERSSPALVKSMRFNLGKSLGRTILFALVIVVGITAGILLECADVMAVLMAPLFRRRR
jgi:hypothetical protein